jgi:aspartate/methionine/tyrosine aminotransferase
MRYRRMPIEVESPEQLGYDTIECNLAESSVSDLSFGEMKIDLKRLSLAYGEHSGKRELRELVAAAYQGIRASDVLITAGAAPALFITATSLLTSTDHLVVVHPNYATNIETPKAIGAAITYVKLEFEKEFRLDIKCITKAIRRNTKLISITYPHNPTGAVLSKDELLQLVRVAEKKNIFLLVDETYRDLSRAEKTPLAASLSEKAISISSLSKAFGLPGIRMGWLITKNKTVQEMTLAAKEQIFVCNSVVDEELALHFFKNKEKFKKKIGDHVIKNFTMLKKWMQQQEHLEWVEPKGGVVCFPRIKKSSKIDAGKFHDILFRKYKTLVGPGHWFGMPRRYMRVGYGWPSRAELRKGLENITKALYLASK